MYLTLARDNPNPCWNKQVCEKLFNFNRIKQYEDEEFNQQVGQMTKVDIPQNEKSLTYWYWNERIDNAGDCYNKFLVDNLYACKMVKTVQCGIPDVCFCGSILTNPNVSRSRRIVGCGI
jgi:hypothetical protein